MSRALERRIIAVCFALAVLGVVCGSASIPTVQRIGHQARWVALIVLWCVTAIAFLRRRYRFPVGTPALVLTAGGFLVGLTFASIGWSSDERLTLHRAVSFVIVVSIAAMLGVMAADDGDLAGEIVVSLVAVATLILAAGFVLLAVRQGYAAQAATTESGWRMRGLGQNPNTVPMLAAVALPGAVFGLLAGRRWVRLLCICFAAVALPMIALSGSRGALLGGAAGAVIPAVRAPSRRLAVQFTSVIVVAFFACAAISQIPRPSPYSAAPPPATSAGSATGGNGNGNSVQPPRVPAGIDHPLGFLSDEVGLNDQSRRTLFGSSGRVQAWEGAIGQGNLQPALGYGFGTESTVFFDRYQTFESDLVENSYVGLYLQLGLVGVVALLTLVLLAVVPAVRIRRGPPKVLASALVGTVGAGVVLACVQSYIYSPGNIAMLPVWVAGGLGVGVSRVGGVAGWAERVLSRRRVQVVWVGCAVLLGLLVPLGAWERHRADAATGRHMEALLSIPGPAFSSHLVGARIAIGYSCLIYKVGTNPTAIELCFSSDGHLAEAIDRRTNGGTPHFYSLRDDPSVSPVRIPLPTLLRLMHKAGLWSNVPLDAPRLPVSGTDFGPAFLPVKP